MSFSKIYNTKKIHYRTPKSFGYWYDVVMGGFITSMVLISLGGLILMKLNLSFWIYFYAVLCIILVVYFQWKDDNFTVIETNLSKSENLQLVQNTLESLNWKYIAKTSEVELTLNKYFLKFLEPTIRIESKQIYINFKYHSSSITGRLPFYFGISTYAKRKFTNKLKD